MLPCVIIKLILLWCSRALNKQGNGMYAARWRLELPQHRY